MQYMLNRGQLVKGGTLAPAVTPLVRIPVNGMREGAVARQAGARHRRLRRGVAAHLDRGRSLQRRVGLPLSAPEGPAEHYHPAGLRGDGPTQAVRYWGLTQQEYYDRADVWPLNPKGEIFVILQMEDIAGHRERSMTF